jgi:RHS repeat-associated protein
VVGSETRLFYFNQQWQCVEEYVSSTCDVRFVWGLRYVDDLVTYRKDSTDYYVLQDANWNVVGLTNAAGAIQERYNYSAFGKLNVFDASFTPKSASTFSLTRSFTGQVLDNETGLMLYRNRGYHPTLGRFIQRDPIKYCGRDKNLFRYSYNSFVSLWDSWGLATTATPPPPDFDTLGCTAEPCKKKCKEDNKGIISSLLSICESKCERFLEGSIIPGSGYKNWYNKNSDLSWVDKLPDCPCEIEKEGDCWKTKDGWDKPAPPSGGYHSGATVCMRSKHNTPIGTVNPLESANQCCYSEDGKLITSGSGMGSADYYQGRVITFGVHWLNDMRPADIAKILDGGDASGPCSMAYLKVRPQKGTEKCLSALTPTN